MENLAMCRICLATNIRLCFIEYHLRDMYERISSITFMREDGRPLVACYICHARLQICYRLRMSCLQSEELLTMMSIGELKPQNVLSTNTFGLASALHLSLGHELQDSTECDVKEEAPEMIHGDELKDIVTNTLEEQCLQIDDYNQCSHLDDPLLVINREPDNVEADYEDIKLEIEDTILEETDQNVADSCPQVADNICPKVVKIVLQRIDVNDTTTGNRVSKKNKIGALKDTEDDKRKIEVEKVEKATRKILETCEILDIKLNKCENVVTSLVNNVCEEKNTNNTSLGRSSISISKNKQFSCDTCKKCFSCKSNLKTHILTHTVEKQYKCNICQKCFNYKHVLNNHIRTHTGEKPYVCNVCTKRFNEKGRLKVHIRTHTGERPYKCNICKKCFARKYVLNNHIRTHTGEKPYVCNVCNKCFLLKRYLGRHILTHTGEKPYQCNVCKTGFIDKAVLINHMRTHTGEKPYQCNICKKKFTRPDGLIKHFRTHTGEKPHQCNYCSKCFTLKYQLRTHIYKHTGEKPFQCNFCKKGFFHKKSLKAHNVTHEK